MVTRTGAWMLTQLCKRSAMFCGTYKTWPNTCTRYLNITTSHFNKSHNKMTDILPNDQRLKKDTSQKAKRPTDFFVLGSVCTRLLSEGESDIRKVAEEISGEIGSSCTIWSTVVDLDVNRLQKRIQSLIDVGCTLNQILENPGVLRYNDKELARRIRKIRDAEEPVNVHTITGTHPKSSKHFTKFSNLFCGKSWMEVLAEKLDCTVAQLLQGVSPGMSYVQRSQYPDRTLKKIDILLSAGFTKSEICRCLPVLNKNVETLQKRVEEIQELGLQNAMTCSWLYQGEAKYRKIITNAQKYSIWGDKWEYLSKILDIPQENLKKHFKRVNLENVIPKIELLIEVGFTGYEILNRPRMIRVSEKKIHKVLQIMRENELNDLDVNQRYTWIVNTIPTLYSGVFTQKTVLSKLLNCSVKTIRDKAPFLKQALSHPDSTILKLVSLLESKGFSKSDIEKCPLVLNHDPKVLESYLNGLEHRMELQPFTEWEEDKVKLLNALQYLIESDMNFYCTGCMDEKEHSEEISEVDTLNEVD